MTYAELKAELLARGFDFLGDRAGQFINWARAELDDAYLWPYREASVQGTPAPLVVADLGVVEAVVNVTLNVPLLAYNYRQLLDDYGDLSIAGSPCFWYKATPSGVPEIATYPTSTDTIGVQYWKVTPDLVDDSDTPDSPSRFHGLIVDMAVRRAYRDSDNGAAAADLNAQIDADLRKMVTALMFDSTDATVFVPAEGVDC